MMTFFHIQLSEAITRLMLRQVVPYNPTDQKSPFVAWELDIGIEACFVICCNAQLPNN